MARINSETLTETKELSPTDKAVQLTSNYMKGEIDLPTYEAELRKIPGIDLVELVELLKPNL